MPQHFDSFYVEIITGRAFNRLQGDDVASFLSAKIREIKQAIQAFTLKTQPLPENVITFVHGNNSQGIPVAVVAAVHHDGFF